jgi:hypothetical protein
MATNLALDDALIEEAVKLGKFRSKREAVNTAVEEYVKRKRQAALIQLFGKIDYYPDYDYKKNRARKKGKG